MARKNKSLADAFSQFQESEQENVSEKDNPSVIQENENENRQPEQEKVDKTKTRNKISIQDDETVNNNTGTVTEDVIQKRIKDIDPSLEYENTKLKPEVDTKTIRDVKNNIMSMYDEKSNKKTVEETHKRSTFLFRKDLQERLDELADGRRGFKTMFLNQAIEALLDEMDEGKK